MRFWFIVLAALLPACARDLVPRTPSARSIVLREEVVIAATPQRVWAVLVDLPSYSRWNPWLNQVEGKAETGATVWADVMLGEDWRRAEHVVLAVEPYTRFCWRDAGWTTAFVYGQRCRWLVLQPDGTVLFRQELLLEGSSKKTALRRYGPALRAGMAAETAALRRRAESGP
ncbi:SRPBCC domain-containing protein [Nannocystis sp. SCPEA4]|uniref:SRPBCC domain-containing protein n=1 Tax=Nannocystis sp. SCPEA4 TaxID=2996787 RepID=UPI00226EDC7E|nr:SRPBCC domain-containing protein [Nannocystis sp. SCPEA4]MCY1059170.1 SRPBCC domain-containing protein [Nannocystis sp. SCPEA4]